MAKSKRPDIYRQSTGDFHRYTKVAPGGGATDLGTGYSSWWKAAFREGNLFAAGQSFIAHRMAMGEFQESPLWQKDYQASLKEDPKATLGPYASFTEEYPSLLRASSPEQLDYIKSTISRDKRQRDVLNQKGFAESFLPYLMIGAVSPENWIPMAGAFRLGFMGKGSLGFSALRRLSPRLARSMDNHLADIMTGDWIRRQRLAFPDITDDMLKKHALQQTLNEAPLLAKIGATALEGVGTAALAEPLFRLDNPQKPMMESVAVVVGSGVFGAGFGALFGGLGSAYGKALGDLLGVESMTNFRLDVMTQVGAEWKTVDDALQAEGHPTIQDTIAEEIGATRNELRERAEADGEELDSTPAPDDVLEQPAFDVLDNPVHEAANIRRGELINEILANRDPDSPIGKLIALGNDKTWFGKLLGRLLQWSPNLRSAWTIVQAEDEVFRILGANPLTRESGFADQMGDLTKPSLDTAESLATLEGLRRVQELNEVFERNKAKLGGLSESQFRGLVAKRARRVEMLEDEELPLDEEWLPNELEGNKSVYPELEGKTPEEKQAIIDAVNEATDEVYVPYIDEVTKVFQAVGMLDSALTRGAMRKHAANYVTRMYDKSLVKANARSFKSAVRAGLTEMRGTEEPKLQRRLEDLEDQIDEYKSWLEDPDLTADDIENTRIAIKSIQEMRDNTLAEIQMFKMLDNWEDSEAMLDQVMRNVTGDRVLYHSERTNLVENSMMARVLDLEDRFIEPYLINDVGVGMTDSVKKFFPQVVAFRYLSTGDQLKSMRVINELEDQYNLWMQDFEDNLLNNTLTEQNAETFFEIANNLLDELNFLNMHNGLTTLSPVRTTAGAVSVVDQFGNLDIASASQRIRDMITEERDLSTRLANVNDEIIRLTEVIRGPQTPVPISDPSRRAPGINVGASPNPYLNPNLIENIAHRLLLDRQERIQKELASDPNYQESRARVSALARDFQDNFDSGTFTADDIAELDARIVEDAPQKVRDQLEPSLQQKREISRSSLNENGNPLQRKLQNMSPAQYLAFVVDKVMTTRVRFDRQSGQYIFPTSLTDIATVDLLNAVLDNSEGGYLYRANQHGVPRGQILFSPGDPNIIIQGFNRADASTALHEQMHAVRRTVFTNEYVQRGLGDIDEQDLDVAAQWSADEAGIELRKGEDGEYIWTTEMEEAFARGFETYILEGNAPTTALEKAFETLSRVLSTIYQRLVAVGMLPELTDEMRGIYDKVVQRSEFLENNNHPMSRLSDAQKSKVVDAFNLVGTDDIEAVHTVLDAMGLDQTLITYENPTIADYLNESRERRRRIRDEIVNEQSRIERGRPASLLRQEDITDEDIRAATRYASSSSGVDLRATNAQRMYMYDNFDYNEGGFQEGIFPMSTKDSIPEAFNTAWYEPMTPEHFLHGLTAYSDQGGPERNIRFHSLDVLADKYQDTDIDGDRPMTAAHMSNVSIESFVRRQDGYTNPQLMAQTVYGLHLLHTALKENAVASQRLDLLSYEPMVRDGFSPSDIAGYMIHDITEAAKQGGLLNTNGDTMLMDYFNLMPKTGENSAIHNKNILKHIHMATYLALEGLAYEDVNQGVGLMRIAMAERIQTRASLERLDPLRGVHAEFDRLPDTNNILTKMGFDIDVLPEQTPALLSVEPSLSSGIVFSTPSPAAIRQDLAPHANLNDFLEGHVEKWWDWNDVDDMDPVFVNQVSSDDVEMIYRDQEGLSITLLEESSAKLGIRLGQYQKYFEQNTGEGMELTGDHHDIASKQKEYLANANDLIERSRHLIEQDSYDLQEARITNAMLHIAALQLSRLTHKGKNVATGTISRELPDYLPDTPYKRTRTPNENVSDSKIIEPHKVYGDKTIEETAHLLTLDTFASSPLAAMADLLTPPEGGYTADSSGLPDLMGLVDVIYGPEVTRKIRGTYSHTETSSIDDLGDLFLEDLALVGNNIGNKERNLRVVLANRRLRMFRNKETYGERSAISGLNEDSLAHYINLGQFTMANQLSRSAIQVMAVDNTNRRLSYGGAKLGDYTSRMTAGLYPKNDNPVADMTQLIHTEDWQYSDEVVGFESENADIPSLPNTGKLRFDPGSDGLEAYIRQELDDFSTGEDNYLWALHKDDPEFVEDWKEAIRWYNKMRYSGYQGKLPIISYSSDTHIDAHFAKAVPSMFSKMLNSALQEKMGRDVQFSVQFAPNTWYNDESGAWLGHIAITLRTLEPLLAHKHDVYETGNAAHAALQARFFNTDDKENKKHVMEMLGGKSDFHQPSEAKAGDPESQNQHFAVGTQRKPFAVTKDRKHHIVTVDSNDPTNIQYNLAYDGSGESPDIKFGVRTDEQFKEMGLGENVGFVESLPEDLEEAQKVLMTAMQRMVNFSVTDIAIKIDPSNESHKKIADALGLKEGKDGYYTMSVHDFIPDLKRHKPELPNLFRYMSTDAYLPLANQKLSETLINTLGVHNNVGQMQSMATSRAKRMMNDTLNEEQPDRISNRSIGSRTVNAPEGNMPIAAHMLSPYWQNKSMHLGMYDKYGNRDVSKKPEHAVDRKALQYRDKEGVVRNINDARSNIQSWWLMDLKVDAFQQMVKTAGQDYRYLEELQLDVLKDFDGFDAEFDKALKKLKRLKHPGMTKTESSHYSTGDNILNAGAAVRAITSGNIASANSIHGLILALDMVRSARLGQQFEGLKVKLKDLQREMKRLSQNDPEWRNTRDISQAVANGMVHEVMDNGFARFTLSDKDATQLLRGPDGEGMGFDELVARFLIDSNGYKYLYHNETYEEVARETIKNGLMRVPDEDLPETLHVYRDNDHQFFKVSHQDSDVYLVVDHDQVIKDTAVYHSADFVGSVSRDQENTEKAMTGVALAMATLNGAQGAVMPKKRGNVSYHTDEYGLLKHLGFVQVGSIDGDLPEGVEEVAVMAFLSEQINTAQFGADPELDTRMTHRKMRAMDHAKVGQPTEATGRYPAQSRDRFDEGTMLYEYQFATDELSKPNTLVPNSFRPGRESMLFDNTMPLSRDVPFKDLQWMQENLAPEGHEVRDLRHAVLRSSVYKYMNDYLGQVKEFREVLQGVAKGETEPADVRAVAQYQTEINPLLLRDMHSNKLKHTEASARVSAYYSQAPEALFDHKVTPEGATDLVLRFVQAQNTERLAKTKTSKDLDSRGSYSGVNDPDNMDKEFVPAVALRQDDYVAPDPQKQRIRKSFADPELRKKFKRPPEYLRKDLHGAKVSERVAKRHVAGQATKKLYGMTEEPIVNDWSQFSEEAGQAAMLEQAPRTSMLLKEYTQKMDRPVRGLRQDDPAVDVEVLQAMEELERKIAEKDMLARSLRDQRTSLREVAEDLGSFHDVHSRARKGSEAYMPLPMFKRNDRRMGEAAQDVRAADSMLRLVLSRIKKETFGDGVSLESQFNQIERQYAPLIREAEENGTTSTGKTVRDLLKRKEVTKRDATAMLQRVLGTHGQSLTGNDLASRVSSTARDLNYMRMMGGVTLSSFPDVAMAISTAGMRHYMGAWGEFLKQNLTSSENKPSRDSLAYLLYSAETVLGQHRHTAMNLVDEELSSNATPFERGVKNLTQGFGRLTGIQHWNGAMKAIAASAIQSRIIEVGYKVKKGKASNLEKELLRQFGISPNMAKQFADIHEAVGETGSTALGSAFYHARLDRWEGAIGSLEADQVEYLASMYKMSTMQAVSRTIVTPGVGDLPLMASATPMGKMLFQFKSFTLAATQQVLLSGIQRGVGYGDISQLVLLMSLSSMGSLVYVLKEMIAGRDPFEREDWLQKMMIEGVDRGGSLGVLSEVNQIMEKVAGFGMSSLTETGPLSRYMQRNKLDAILGPSVGLFGDLLEGAGVAPQWMQNAEIGKGQASALRRLLPYQNLLQTRFLLDVAPNMQGKGGYFDNFKTFQERLRTNDWQ